MESFFYIGRPGDLAMHAAPYWEPRRRKTLARAKALPRAGEGWVGAYGVGGFPQTPSPLTPALSPPLSPAGERELWGKDGCINVEY